MTQHVGADPLVPIGAQPDLCKQEYRRALMATAPRSPATREVDYPTSDGKPMAETDLHRQVTMDTIETLEDFFAADLDVYVSGNILLYYEEGSPRKHVSPDVLVVLGSPKRPPRNHYLLWKEGKQPDLIVEITSKTTRRHDQNRKWKLYRDVLKVPEYFQFDPTEDYLDPSLQGFRLVDAAYEPIAPVDGRLPSNVLGLHLERSGPQLRFHDPATDTRLPTRGEGTGAEAAARRRPESENERLRRENESLRRHLADN